MRRTRQSHGQENARENFDPATNPRMQLWPDYEPPTSRALAQFKITVIWPQDWPMSQIVPRTTESAEEEPEPTRAAEIDVHYHGGRAQVSVPGRHTGHLLDVLTYGFSVGGIYGATTMVLNSPLGSPSIRAALCALCVAVIGGLALVTIHRNRT
jgi:hypothetical protein